MMRQLLFSLCFVVVAFLAFVTIPNPVVRANRHAPIAAQISPLASPLATPEEISTVQTLPTATNFPVPAPANGSPISVVLVGIVLLGLLIVISLVIWRRR